MARKKALIIGINYYNSKHQLNGCINDANNVREFLVNDCGFSPEAHDMVLLTDDPDNYGTPFWPSGQNMMAAFQWLASCNHPGDVLWLSYSGHGGASRLPSLLLDFRDCLRSLTLTQARPGICRATVRRGMRVPLRCRIRGTNGLACAL